MESLIEKAKKNIVKFGNKISDSYYRDKWDKSQVNTALFDTEDTDVSNFEKPVKEYEENKEPTVEETIIEEPIVENELDSVSEFCYYTAVLRKSENKKILYRKCDNNRYELTDDDIPDKLSYTFCPICGKKVSYIETSIE